MQLNKSDLRDDALMLEFDEYTKKLKRQAKKMDFDLSMIGFKVKKERKQRPYRQYIFYN